LFRRDYRDNGVLKTGTYLATFKLGEIVDIKGCGAQQKGMPHKFYHGKTGIVWNVTKRAVGVQVNKLVRTRVMQKRIHVRLEHIKTSTCRAEFLARMRVNEAKKAEAKKTGVKVCLKRLPAAPSGNQFVGGQDVETLYPLPYDQLVR
jgi:large subunit ribosomal protein L21e